MKFSESRLDGVKIEVEVPSDYTVDEALGEFKNFLRACGYVIEYDSNLFLEEFYEQ